MWQRFTERARKVIFYAQEEAEKFAEGYVGPEHLLLGLVREKDSVAARVLGNLRVSLHEIKSEVEKVLPREKRKPVQEMTLTPRAKRVIDLAYDEARNLNNNYIGTEHILLGLVRDGDGIAGRVLAKLGVGLKEARREVMGLQDREIPEREDRRARAASNAFRADRESSGLVVIDIQDSFLAPIADRARVIERSKFLVEIAKLLEIPIVVTEQHADRMGGTNVELLDVLGSKQARHNKLCFSACDSPAFWAEWDAAARGQAVLVGIETHICVTQTALDLLAAGTRVFVCADAVAARSREAHDIALARLANAGAGIAHTESIAYEWLREAGTPEFKQALEIIKRYAG